MSLFGDEGQATTAIRHAFDQESFVAWIRQTLDDPSSSTPLRDLFQESSSQCKRNVCTRQLQHQEGPPECETTTWPQVSANQFSFRQFGFGQSNPTYLITWMKNPVDNTEHPQHPISFVLRKKPNQVAHRSAHDLHREYVVLQTLARHNADHSAKNHRNVPVPRVYAYCSDRLVIGAEFYLMEFVRGRIFTNPSLPGMKNRRHAYESVMATLAAIHSVDIIQYNITSTIDNDAHPHSSSNPTTTPTIPYAQRQLERLTTVSAMQAARMNTTVPPELSRLADELRQRYQDLRRSAQQQRTQPTSTIRPILSHGDFKIDNLIFHETEPIVIAVLDWELCSFNGDPLADLANLLLLYNMPPQGLPGLTGIHRDCVAQPNNDDDCEYRNVNLIPHQNQLIALYCQYSADTLHIPEERIIRSLPFYLSLVLFKYAVIVQGVAQRVMAGTASSAQASYVAKQFPRLVQMGHEILSSSEATAPTPVHVTMTKFSSLSEKDHGIQSRL